MTFELLKYSVSVSLSTIIHIINKWLSAYLESIQLIFIMAPCDFLSWKVMTPTISSSQLQLAVREEPGYALYHLSFRLECIVYPGILLDIVIPQCRAKPTMIKPSGIRKTGSL